MKHEDEWRYEGFWLLRAFLRVIFVIAVLEIVLGIFSNGMFGMMRPMFFFSNWVWDIIGIFFLLWFISWIATWPWHNKYWHEEREIRILRRRYARGEISEAQFKRMMKNLSEHSS
jgi:uncharacterized membrane protein